MYFSCFKGFRYHIEKKSLYAQERERKDIQEERTNFIEFIPELDAKKICVIDESGFPLNMTKRNARSKKGDRIKMPAPMRGKNISAIGAIMYDKIVDIALLEGSMVQASVEAFIEESVLPHLSEGDILLIDNAPVHNLGKIKELLKKVGALVLPLPRYSPDLSPIEMMWSKLKEFIRAANPRTPEELFIAFNDAINMIDQDDLQAWYEHCGYWSEAA